MVLESTVEGLLRNRPPSPESGFSLDSLPAWLQPFVGLFAFLSLIGLILRRQRLAGMTHYRFVEVTSTRNNIQKLICKRRP
jgi:hypothetical protein